MLLNDGRVVSNFIAQALQNEKLTVSFSSGGFTGFKNCVFFLLKIYGDGK
jgi:hypothetical protein